LVLSRIRRPALLEVVNHVNNNVRSSYLPGKRKVGRRQHVPIQPESQVHKSLTHSIDLQRRALNVKET
jgi:hypothetical protein